MEFFFIDLNLDLHFFFFIFLDCFGVKSKTIIAIFYMVISIYFLD